MADAGEDHVYNSGVKESGEPLETIYLGNKAVDGATQHPSLAFNEQASSEPYNSSSGMPSPLAYAPGVAVVSVIEGTEQQMARPRTRSNLSIKEWSSHHLKITKQLVQERFGHGMRTVDSQLEQRIESLRDTQKKYAQLVSLSVQFHTHFLNVVEAQKSLAEHFAFMSVKAPELHVEFQVNAETQKIISRNGETLLASLKLFTANLQTISTKTIDDTLQTAKSYDSARLAYDAYRSECESLQKQAATSQKAASSLASNSTELDKCKKKFERLRQDIDIKLKLLDENKLKVTHKQLILLQGAFAAYYSCNHEAVEALLEKYSDKMEESGGNEPPAWLEDLPSQHK